MRGVRRPVLALIAAAFVLAPATPSSATVATDAPTTEVTVVPTVVGSPDTTAATDGPADTPTTATGPSDSTTPSTTAPLLDDPNGCDAVVWDPEGQLNGDTRVAQRAERLQAQGYDVHVRVEAAPDGTIDDRLGQLERVCSGWRVDGDRAPGLLVVMVVPSQRRTGIWYGSRAGELADWWERIQTDEMNPRFRSGDYAGGLADGLDAVTALLLDGRTPSASPGAAFPTLPLADDGDSDGGSSMVWAWALLLLGGGFGFLVWIKGLIDGTGGLDGSPTDGGSSSSSRRRSFGSWSSSSSSSRRSSSSRSSGGSRRSGGSGRSGGGSTSW